MTHLHRYSTDFALMELRVTGDVGVPPLPLVLTWRPPVGRRFGSRTLSL
jgi:hypothetical protein